MPLMSMSTLCFDMLDIRPGNRLEKGYTKGYFLRGCYLLASELCFMLCQLQPLLLQFHKKKWRGHE